jgi:hypothetical protein
LHSRHRSSTHIRQGDNLAAAASILRAPTPLAAPNSNAVTMVVSFAGAAPHYKPGSWGYQIVQVLRDHAPGAGLGPDAILSAIVAQTDREVPEGRSRERQSARMSVGLRQRRSRWGRHRHNKLTAANPAYPVAEFAFFPAVFFSFPSPRLQVVSGLPTRLG